VYTQIAPVSWLMASGVSEGRKAVNFSEWAAYSREQQRDLLVASCEDAREGRMPGPYARLRPETRLSTTGLKPAGRNLGPAIPAVDEAIRVGSVDPVRRLLTEGGRRRGESEQRQHEKCGLERRFKRVGDVERRRQLGSVWFVHLPESRPRLSEGLNTREQHLAEPDECEPAGQKRANSTQRRRR
jgi:hypothetical protein